jgi:isoamylase
MFAIFDAYWEPLEFEFPRVPSAKSGPWRRWIDTFLESPQDIVEWRSASLVSANKYHAGPRSVVALWASHAHSGNELLSSGDKHLP